MKKILVIALCLLVLAGCGKTPVVDTIVIPPDNPVDKPQDKPQDAPEGDMVLHPLTGLVTEIEQDILNRKPVAIMIGNSSAALPQLGISQADILVEMMAEGGGTRIMAIWQDPSKVSKIGSVRSSRPYFIDMAQWLDAYYLHFGGSVPAYQAIADRGDLVNLDGIRGGWEGTLFLRDKERLKTFKREHTVVTSGERIEAAIAKKGAASKKDLLQTAFVFDEAHSAANGTPHNSLVIDYFAINRPGFTYNQTNESYGRTQYKKEHMDGEYNLGIEVKNIFVLEMNAAPVPGDPLKIIEVQAVGGGSGKYFSGGKYIDIMWSKVAYNKPLLLTDISGRPLKVSPGKSFIEVIKTGSKITIE